MIRKSLIACALSLGMMLAVASRGRAAEIIRTTNFGGGADAEVRESNPTQNRGASTEIATRVKNDLPGGDPNDGNDRNSVIYLQFDLTGLTVADTPGAILRMTYRNNNLNASRVGDTDGVPPDLGQNGFEYYGIADYTFTEAVITYNNAKGMTPDGNVGTKDFNSDASLLGTKDLPLIGTQNWLPVGGVLDFQNAALDAFLAQEILAGHRTAVIAVVHRNDASSDEPANWTNFNYLFNPKEQTTLNNDPNYDADITDAFNPLGSPFSGADNTNGDFSPQLVLNSNVIPEPASAVVMLIAGAGLMRRRR